MRREGTASQATGTAAELGQSSSQTRAPMVDALKRRHPGGCFGKYNSRMMRIQKRCDKKSWTGRVYEWGGGGRCQSKALA